MSPNWEQVLRWRSDSIDSTAQKLRTIEDKLIEYGHQAKNLAPTSWTGTAATLASIQLIAHQESLEDRVTELAAVRKALFDVSDAIEGIGQVIRQAREYARFHDLNILLPDGGVVDTYDLVIPAGATAHDAEMAVAERQSYVDECVALIEEALRRAHDTDVDLDQLLKNRVLSGVLAAQDASSLEEARTAGESAGSPGPYEPPQEGSTPAQNAAWWAVLTEDEQSAVLDHHPEWIANLDGIPYALRAQANQSLIPGYLTDLNQQLNSLEAQRLQILSQVDGSHSSGADQAQLLEITRQMKDVKTKISQVESLRDQLGDSSLVGLDITKDRVEAIVVNGDLDTADHVAVFTPGLTSTVDGIVDGYNSDMRALKNRAEDSLRKSRQSDGETVATVTWLGYQAPQWPKTFNVQGESVASSEIAREGGKDLANFYRGIQASSTSGERDVVALGHSYGSTTTGYALTESGTGVSRAGFYGSPGLGVSNLDELQIPSGQSYYLEADLDPVGDLSRFQGDPSGLRGMNGMDTHAVPQEGLDGIIGHSSYMDPETTSQHNLALLVAGREDLIIKDSSNSPVDDTVDRARVLLRNDPGQLLQERQEPKLR